MYNIFHSKGALICLFIASLGCYVFVSTAEIGQLPFCDHATSDDNPPRRYYYLLFLGYHTIKMLSFCDRGIGQ